MLFFTSDLHIFHENVIRYSGRPYKDVQEMNEMLVKNWNDTVSPDDTVYCLGDFSMAARPVETFTPRLNGTKYLVPGNHDFCHSYHKKSRNPENRAKWIKQYEDWGWKVLEEQVELLVLGIAGFTLCHLPYATPFSDGYEGGDKYATYRPVDYGRILLCGHVHEKWKTRVTPKGTLMINVGVDVWGQKPVSIDEIAKLMDSQASQKIIV